MTSTIDFEGDLDAAVTRFEDGDFAAAASTLGALYRRSGVAEREQVDEVVNQMLGHLARKERRAFKTALVLGMEGTSRGALDREAREAALRDAGAHRLGWNVILQLVAVTIAFIVDMTVKLFATLLRRAVEFSARQWVYHFFTRTKV